MLLTLLLSIIIICFNIEFIITVSSAEDNYKIDIVDKNYKIIKTKQIKDQTWIHYNINIILQNSGNKTSDDITVEIEDMEGFIIKMNATIGPGELKLFNFDDYPLLEKDVQKINISFYPTDNHIPLKNNNHGEDSLILKSNGTNDNSTPGFEFIFIILSSLIIILLHYIRKLK